MKERKKPSNLLSSSYGECLFRFRLVRGAVLPPSNDRNFAPAVMVNFKTIPHLAGQNEEILPLSNNFLSRIPPLTLLSSRFSPPFISTLNPHHGKPALDSNKRSLETDLNLLKHMNSEQDVFSFISFTNSRLSLRFV